MPLVRSLFFAPANRPDLVAKFPRFAADCYVIDLEEARRRRTRRARAPAWPRSSPTFASRRACPAC